MICLSGLPPAKTIPVAHALRPGGFGSSLETTVFPFGSLGSTTMLQYIALTVPSPFCLEPTTPIVPVPTLVRPLVVLPSPSSGSGTAAYFSIASTGRVIHTAKNKQNRNALRAKMECEYLIAVSLLVDSHSQEKFQNERKFSPPVELAATDKRS